MNIEQATHELEQSERGQHACKLLLESLKSGTILGLDVSNSEAIATLATQFLLGTSTQACAVKDALQGVVERHQWVNQ